MDLVINNISFPKNLNALIIFDRVWFHSRKLKLMKILQKEIDSIKIVMMHTRRSLYLKSSAILYS